MKRVKVYETSDHPAQIADYVGDCGNGYHLVSLQKEYREYEWDDGLRELTTDQFEVVDDAPLG